MMGLDSIWDEEGNWLTNKSNGFSARSTGCSCCSVKLETEKEVRKEAIDSLHWILRASRYFKWDIDSLLKKAKTEMNKKRK